MLGTVAAVVRERRNQRLFTWDHRAMAGVLQDPVWGTFAVEAVKGTAPVTGVAQPGSLSVLSYFGTWDFRISPPNISATTTAVGAHCP